MVPVVSLVGAAVTAQSDKKNDGTDSNFVDPDDKGGRPHSSQITLLTTIGVMLPVVSLVGAVATARSDEKNDGTDSNFVDPDNNGGQLFSSQIQFLTLIGTTFGTIAICALGKRMSGR
mmetsp:Transcript_45581/g.96912  ORF Transcript_45581/g.96912 Transcript_45581/m.96912 type:complete len:118 (+) Transcript_45581:175-528(+)